MWDLVAVILGGVAEMMGEPAVPPLLDRAVGELVSQPRLSLAAGTMQQLDGDAGLWIVAPRA